MNQITLKYLKELLSHLEYYNKITPFPVYDTGFVEEIKLEIMKLENENKINYDDEPVEACRFCKSLNIQYDEDNLNVICMRCGSTNELKVFKTIHEYKNFIDGEDT